MKNGNGNGHGNGDGNGKNGKKAEITAAEIREKFKIPYSTINHYTNLGFFPIIRRRVNKRIYNLTEVETRFYMVTKLANEGYPLGLIAKKIMGQVKDELL